MADGDSLRIGVNNAGTATTNLVRGGGTSNIAFRVENNRGDGIYGQAEGRSNPGLLGDPRPAHGVWGDSDQGTGVMGTSNAGAGVSGTSGYYGVGGQGHLGPGVWGASSENTGVFGAGLNRGVEGFSR